MEYYEFFRSSASYRTRIALNLKGLEPEVHSVHLSKDGGDQFKPEFSALNPQQLVPCIVDGGDVLIQSMAIIEYLDEIHPSPALLPSTPGERARVRALAQIIACEVHPLNNLRVRLYLVDEMGVSEEARKTWICHWMQAGFAAYESLLAGSSQTGDFSHGDTPTLADICLIPQLSNARLYNCDLAPYKSILRIEENCQALAAFDKAKPENQPAAAD